MREPLLEVRGRERLHVVFQASSLHLVCNPEVVCEHDYAQQQNNVSVSQLHRQVDINICLFVTPQNAVMIIVRKKKRNRALQQSLRLALTADLNDASLLSRS